MEAAHPGSRGEVLRLAWPIGVSMLSFTLRGFIDMAMVGQLGTDVLGGVGIASIASWVALTVPWGILRGQRPLVAQYLGAGQKKRAFSFGVHAFYVAGAVGLLVLLFRAQLGAGFAAFTAQTELTAAGVAQGSDYFVTRMAWALPTLLTFAVAEYLRSVGQTRVPMVADLVVHPLNVVFNYMLIFGNFGLPAMGARGAALGTGISDLIGLLLILFLAAPRRNSYGAELRDAMRLRWARMKEVVKVGFTGGVQFSIESSSFLMVSWIIGHAGQQALAVHQAGIQIIHLAMLPAVAVADAGSVLIGRYVGSLQWDSVRRTLRSTLEVLVPFMALMSLVFLLFGREMVAVFLKDDDPLRLEQALNLGAGVMLAAALWTTGDALQITFRFALRATGDHHWVMWTGILCSWLLNFPLAWWVVFVLDGDVAQVWLMLAAEVFGGGAIFVWRWRSGAWMRKRLVEAAEEEPDAALAAELVAAAEAPAAELAEAAAEVAESVESAATPPA